MSSTRLTTAAAIVRYLIAQRTVIDEVEVPLFPGVFAIFGHGNVTSLGLALQAAGDALPTWRGQNEQGMGLAAIGYAKAMRRRQIMVATSSIGPGALNMVTAAGVAHANRLPALFLVGDTFASRLPDPVLQQVEHFGDPTITVNDAFKSVSRYWDRIMRPEQIIHSLPHAVAIMLDPADCGPAVIALPQDVQAEAFDFPDEFFTTTVHEIARPRPDLGQLERAAASLRSAKRPLIVAGGGVHYSQACPELAAFAEAHGVPVVETTAGRTSLAALHPFNAGPVGATGCTSANDLAGAADVILAVGTRLQDFTTGSWTAFARDAQLIGLNAAVFDAVKHRSLPVVGDAREGLRELDQRLSGWVADEDWALRAKNVTAEYHGYIDRLADPAAVGASGRPTYAQVIGAVDRAQQPRDYVFAAAGGFPGELINGWRAKEVGDFDCEYGFSCMGYEISGAWGAKMARPNDEVITFVGDGSYMMMNSDLYSSVLSGHKLIVIVCDNGGFAVINRLQINQGGVPFNNLIENARHHELVSIDFAAHAAAMGCDSERVATVHELEGALKRARHNDRTTVIALLTDAYAWTGGGAFWEVGVPEVSDRPEVQTAKAAMVRGKTTTEDWNMTDNVGKLAGKVVVVSGGTQGLGEAIARQVVADGAAGLVIAGRSAARGAALAAELTGLGTPTLYVEADMTDPAAPRSVIAAADERFGVIHGVVNVAAATWRDNVWTATPDGFEEMIAVNVRAPMFMTQAAAEVMRREDVAGSIVNIGSTSGHGGQPFILSYCVSKGALETMTRNLAYSLMRHKIRVNEVAPGWMDTESEDATQRKFHGATDGWLERAEAEQPMGRLIKPPEVAKVVAFYLSDDSGMLTGNIVDYDQSVMGAGDAPKPSLQETPR